MKSPMIFFLVFVPLRLLLVLSMRVFGIDICHTIWATLSFSRMRKESIGLALIKTMAQGKFLFFSSNFEIKMISLDLIYIKPSCWNELNQNSEFKEDCDNLEVR